MKDKWKDAWVAAKTGKLDDISFDLRIRYYSTFKKIQIDEGIAPPSLTPDQKECFWYYGKTGTGKSRSARELYGHDIYLKSAENKWWDGYTGQETVLVEDIDKYHIKQGFGLKIWTDIYAFTAETKGGKMIICPKRFIFTSNWRIREIWNEPQTYEPLERRIKFVLFKKEDDNDEPIIEGEEVRMYSSAYNFNIPNPI